MDMQDRFARSVIVTARALAETATGSRAGVPGDELREMRAWLGRRVEAWEEGPAATLEYDNAVKAMALAALRLHDATFRPQLQVMGQDWEQPTFPKDAPPVPGPRSFLEHPSRIFNLSGVTTDRFSSGRKDKA